MNNWKFLTVFMFFSLLSSAQHSLPIQYDTIIHKYEIIGTGILDFGSTSIRNEISNRMINGGFIDENMKQRSSDRHKVQNRLGVDASAEIEFRDYSTKLFNQDKFGYYVRGGYYNYASASYSDDAFDLFFNGNSQFRGDTAKFSGTQGDLFSFQKVGIGFINKKTKSNLGINFYNISEMYDLFIRDGNLLTNADASNVQFEIDGRLRHADGEKFSKGWGVGVDGDFRIPVKWVNDKDAFFQVQIKNIGFMRLNNISEYQIDTTINFSGFGFNQLFGDDRLQFDNNQDVIDTLGATESRKSMYAMLPGFLQFGKIIDNHNTNRFQSYFGVRIYTTLNFAPLAYIGGQYQLYEWMKLGVQATYGGFSNFRLGFYTQYDFGNFHLGVGSEDLIGAISKSGHGQSVHLKISRLW